LAVKRNLLLTLISLFVLIRMASAGSGASLTGTLRDPQGRSVPGGKLTLFSDTGTAGSTTTADSEGAYRFEGLPDGVYLLRAEAPGFAPYLAQNIRLTAGVEESRDIALELAGMRQQVVVTASSTPQAPEHVSKTVSTIGQPEADARDIGFVTDAVALAPGTRMARLGGPGAYTSIRMRGLRDQDTAVLIDGLRLRDPAATQGDASALLEDLLFTDANRVEVLRGSGSSLYGTNAIGGVINVITDEGGGRTRGNVLLEGGSLGMFRGRALVSGGVGTRLQYSLGAMETDFTTGVGGNAPYRDAGAQGSVTFHLSPSVRLIARFFGGDSFGKVLGEPAVLGSPSGLGIVDAVPLSASLARLFNSGTPISGLNTGNATFIPAPDNPDGTRAARFLDSALMLEGQASPALTYSVNYQLLSDGRRYGDGAAGVGYQPDAGTRSVYDGRIQTVNAQAHYRLGRFNLFSGGYEWEAETYAYDNSVTGNPAAASASNVTERSHTVFAQDQVQLLGGRLQLSGAARAQFFALDAPHFNPMDSAPYQRMAFPAPPAAYTADGSAAYFFTQTGTKLRAHVGRGYRAPSLYERFGAGFDPVYGYSVYGDPRLQPEHSIGIDAGFDQTFWRGRLQASASYFYTWLQNVIGFDTSGIVNSATDPFGRFIGYFNTQGGISRGMELSAAMEPVRSLKITTAYTYVNAIERTPEVGNVLRSSAIPRNQFSIFVTERLKSRLLLTGDTLATSNYLAPVYGDFVTQTYRFAGIHKVNLGASYRIPVKEYQALRFFVRAENIFNQTYFESGFLTPGRTARAGVEFEF
jgi:vitamin B12 transporter